MKKFMLFLISIQALLIQSCSEEFNLNAPYENVYILDCILQNDSPIQYAILKKNFYTENGGYPNNIPTDQYVQGASIKIIYNNKSYVLRDTSVLLTSGTNSSTINCYYIKDLTIEPGKIVKIEASTPDGTQLESMTKIPSIKFSGYTFRFPPVYLTGYSFVGDYDWSWTSNSGADAHVLSIPQLEIFYSKIENGIISDKVIQVPLTYYSINGVPVNVSPAFNVRCETYIEAVHRTMKDISGNDPIKSNYRINDIVFSVTGLDQNLARYYTVYNTHSDSFTIKLNQTDYSSISGGRGIFGARYKFTKAVMVDSLYIKSFGYKYNIREYNN